MTIDRRSPGLADRLLNLNIVLRSRVGPRLESRVRDLYGPSGVFGLLEYDFVNVAWQNAEFVVDAGANVGAFSLWARHRGAHNVLAIEPDPSTAQLLIRNVSGDGVEVVIAALAGEDGSARLSVSRLSTGSKVGPAGGGPEVPTKTLEHLLGGASWPRVDVLKMDIEGAEYEVLRSTSDQWLERIGVMIVELHGGPGPERNSVLDRLRSLQFRIAVGSAGSAGLEHVLAWRPGAQAWVETPAQEGSSTSR